jgi:hypothetical protein
MLYDRIKSDKTKRAVHVLVKAKIFMDSATKNFIQIVLSALNFCASDMKILFVILNQIVSEANVF